MKGRTLAALLTLVLVLAALGQSIRWRNRMTASRLLSRVEQLTLAAVRYGQAPVKLMADNLEALRRAAPLNPVEVGIPMARGTQYLFLVRRKAPKSTHRPQARASSPGRPHSAATSRYSLWALAKPTCVCSGKKATPRSSRASLAGTNSAR